MEQITVILKAGQKPTKEELKRAKQEFRAAKKLGEVYDPECPPSSPEALVEFAAMARELRKNRRNPSPVVALRLKPDVLETYKALGKGYTGIMAEVLSYAAANPEFLKQALQ